MDGIHLKKLFTNNYPKPSFETAFSMLDQTPTVRKISSVLIANRGEIARRIQHTCHALGIKTIAIYTQEDQHLSYVCHANEAYKLPQSGAAGYLDQEAIIEIAYKARADAIHPGYGFLSENGYFAKAVIDAGIIWIGPTPENILLLADKAKAQEIMKKNGIPTIPGKIFDAQLDDAYKNAKAFACCIRFPVLLKCAHGGGGKGMRLVKTLPQFQSAWKLVKSESKKFFNSNTIIVEKQIEHPRHIEVQIAGDGINHIHLFERECSLQRRNQKIVEETPCLFISDEMKKKLFSAAIKAAKAVYYKNIGTVEFLVGENKNFYFLEMNTRLQVEHSVTELTTDIDLVALGITIAEINKLPHQQKHIVQHGHAIECRIYAENPQQNFAPSTGLISNLVLPNNPFLRIDHDLEENLEITPFFDPMLLKFTTKGFCRNNAISYMVSSLQDTNLFGIETNIDFLKNVLSSDEFLLGKIHTQLLQNDNYTHKMILTASNHLQNNELSDKEKKLLFEEVKKHLYEIDNSSKRPSDCYSPWRNQLWE